MWRKRLKNFLDQMGDMSAAWPLLVVFAITFVFIAYLQPLKAGLAVWGVSKVALSAWLGNVIDRMSFRADARPHAQATSVEHSAAWLRRALIIAACIIAAGMIP